MKMTSLKINGRTVSRLSINGREVALGPQCDALCFTAEEANSTVKLTANGSAPDVNLQTSTNGRTWTPYTVGDNITLANIGDKVYFKAVGSNSSMTTSPSEYNKFEMTGKIAASGNVNSLLEENEETAKTIGLATGQEFCYAYLFHNCAALTTAPELPSNTLVYGCYAMMFYGCSSLTQSPSLPADTLAEFCYMNMFTDCGALTTAPELPATDLVDSCYSYMFQGCASLNYVKVGFYNWMPNATDNWLPSTSGTFTCPRELIDNTTERTTSTVPESWTMVAV